MAEDMFRFCDDLGPEKIIHFANASVGLKGILVVDNVAAGPAIGGTRMAPDVSVDECFRLARAMTFKNAAASLPHGGAKAVIFGDPDMPAEQKEHVIRAYACALAEITDFIAGPDMGTDETAMAWVRDEIGRSVGLPREVGGIPLDEIGATGFGLATAAEVAQDFCDIKIDGARIAVQGFGAVGKNVARFLTERGAILVSASDSRGTITDADGIDVDALIEHKEAGKPVAEFSSGKALDRDDIVGVPCDIWIPAARPDVLRKDNVEQLDCKMVLEGANIPATPEAEDYLYEKGVLVVPDFIANAGGVICAAVEYQGGTQSNAFATIEEKLRFNTRAVLEAAREKKLKPREAAVKLAEERVRRAMELTRWG